MRTPAAGRRSPTIAVAGAALFWFVFCGPHVSQAIYPWVGQNIYAPLALVIGVAVVGRGMGLMPKSGAIAKQMQCG
jgi:hypothetical protein